MIVESDVLLVEKVDVVAVGVGVVRVVLLEQTSRHDVAILLEVRGERC